MSAEISIVVPVYNTGSRLRVSIASLLNQTFSNIHVIAVNDCSTDDSGATLGRAGSRQGLWFALGLKSPAA